ncbi:MAG: hypothetical protein GC157_18425 [Frankiales bacterium]|nr:hypothetical protein [Frankiales bacterium]
MSESPEPAVRVTLSDMYQLLQQLDKKMDSVTGNHDNMAALLSKHDERLNSHSDSIHSQGERIGKAEAEIAALKADKAPKPNAVAIAVVIVAALAVAVAVISIVARV